MGEDKLSEKEIKEIYEKVKKMHFPTTHEECYLEFIRRLKILEKSYVFDELKELIREKHGTQ